MANEKMCEIKKTLIDVVYDVVTSGDLDSVCAAELGEVVDIIKDIEEAYYYSSITTAMEATDEPETYVRKYIPAYESRMYFHKDEVTMDDIIESITEMMEATPSESQAAARQELIDRINKI